MRLIFSKNSWEDYISWQTEDKKVLKKINELIKDIQRSPYEGLGKPEPLKFDLTGLWSRRKHDGGHDGRRESEADMESVFSLFPRLKERERQLAGTLSGGEQQMLAIGRSLMSRPDFIMLDEPSMGLAPLVIKLIFSAIVSLSAQGKTILVVEQNAKAILKIASRGYVMETGSLVLEGTGPELLANHDVQRAYLGKEYSSIEDEREQP